MSDTHLFLMCIAAVMAIVHLASRLADVSPSIVREQLVALEVAVEVVQGVGWLDWTCLYRLFTPGLCVTINIIKYGHETWWVTSGSKID